MGIPIEIKNSDEKHNQFIEQSFEGIAILDESGTIIDWNPAMERIYHIKAEDVIGKLWNSVSAISNHVLEDILRTGDSPLAGVPVNIDFINKNQEKKIIQQVIFPIKTENGFLTGIVIRDVTEFRKREKEIILEKEKAEERDRLKSMFLANISHELRTAMNGIIGFVDLIDDSAIEEESRKKYTRVIKENSEYILSIVSDIVDISLLESGQMRIYAYKFDLHQMLDELYNKFNLELKSKEKNDINIFLRKEDPAPELKIKTDELRLKQVLTNLLNNAVEYTDKGTIEFGYKVRNESIVFFVRDTGIGISTEKQKGIFDRFKLADETNSKKYSGTGLALSISKGIVELMGGNILLESEPQKGATFYFTLPSSLIVKSESQPSKKSTATSGFPYSWEDKKILIVEDIDYNYQLIIEVLKATHVKYHLAMDGAQAIEYCKNNSDLDLVLMDLQIPNINGYEATKVIKKIQPQLPVIAQTAFAQQNDREKALAAGCDDYIAKPFSVPQLLSVISKFL